MGSPEDPKEMEAEQPTTSHDDEQTNIQENNTEQQQEAPSSSTTTGNFKNIIIQKLRLVPFLVYIGLFHKKGSII